MKTISNLTIGLVTAAILMVGCGESSKKATPPPTKDKVANTVTEESLGLRKTDIYTEESTTGEKTEYATADAGTSTKIARAFQDAPPMIPHSTEGMLPIKINDNQCTGCHMPDVASSMGATPLPVSHFTDFRPKNKVVAGIFEKAVDNYKNEVSIKKTNKLQGSRFNCTLCHAPQSQGKLAVKNNFETIYAAEDGATKSTWAGTKLTDSLDTVGSQSYITDADIANKDSAAGHLNEH